MRTSDKICAHHVGARGGTRPFPTLANFETDIINVLYDADKKCLADIADTPNAGAAHVITVPACLGRTRGKRIFNINSDPFTNSLRAIHPHKKAWYFYFRKLKRDVVFGEAMKTVVREPVSVVTLDSLCLGSRTRLPSPDILSLDTQGTELEILQGGERTIHNNAVCVISEVSFHEVYRGQKLFGAVTAWLAKRGFSFVKFTKYILDCSPYRYPVGLRGEGFQIATDALYLRDIASVRRITDAVARRRMFEKLAFVSVVYLQLEYALECLKETQEIHSRHPATCAYQSFVRSLADIAFESTGGLTQGPRVEALCREYGLLEQADAFERIRKEHL